MSWMKWMVDCPFTHWFHQWLRGLPSAVMDLTPVNSSHSITFNSLHLSLKKDNSRLHSSLGQQEMNGQLNWNEGRERFRNEMWRRQRGLRPITHLFHNWMQPSSISAIIFFFEGAQRAHKKKSCWMGLPRQCNCLGVPLVCLLFASSFLPSMNCWKRMARSPTALQ